jgi:tyrosyl-DNA phosphodiesterase-1
MSIKTTSRTSLKQLLSLPGLTELVLSSFAVDMDWLETILPTKSVWLSISSPEVTPGHIIKLPHLNLVFPRRTSAFGAMHVKLFILFSDHVCRIVIPSANLVPYDWDIMENIVYFQDFPASRSPEPSDFHRVLRNLLIQMSFPAHLSLLLDQYDFSSAIGHLVSSIQGKFIADSRFNFGHLKLSRILDCISEPCSSEKTVCYQTSSMGNLNQKWMTEFTHSCQSSHLSLVFPTKQTVLKACEQGGSGGTICFNRKYWENSNFPKHIMRDSLIISRKPGALLHSKMMICYPLNETPVMNLNHDFMPGLRISKEKRSKAW